MEGFGLVKSEDKRSGVSMVFIGEGGFDGFWVV
jgi:hypothetical protein